MKKCGKKCGIFKILQKSKTRKASNHRRLRVSIAPAGCCKNFFECHPFGRLFSKILWP